MAGLEVAGAVPNLFERKDGSVHPNLAVARRSLRIAWSALFRLVVRKTAVLPPALCKTYGLVRIVDFLEEGKLHRELNVGFMAILK